MAQAATADTDELLSQLASSEIDRLLAEADGNPAPPERQLDAMPAKPRLLRWNLSSTEGEGAIVAERLEISCALQYGIFPYR